MATERAGGCGARPVRAMPCAADAITASNTTPRIGIYQRRRPERTATYQAVQQQLESWREEKRLEHPDGGDIPQYIDRDLRGFLRCGILAHGFAYTDVGKGREQERKLCPCPL